jgi:hypothetical protein
MGFRLIPATFAVLALATAGRAQVLEFESGGLKYKALSHHGVTVMFAPLQMRIHDFAVVQVSISNGSPAAWTVKPEDFKIEHDGESIQVPSGESIVHFLIQKGNHRDVVKLTAAYEAALYGIPNVHSTNGFETRRLNAVADGGSSKVKAAAAASAIVLVSTKLLPGQSTDGAVFYKAAPKPITGGKLVVNTAGETFEFPFDEIRLK